MTLYFVTDGDSYWCPPKHEHDSGLRITLSLDCVFASREEAQELCKKVRQTEPEVYVAHIVSEHIVFDC